MEYFGIVKFRRTRQVFSKSKNAYVAIHDYIVASLNSDSNQSYAFSANEDKNKALMSQGMKDGALGTVYFYCEAKPYTGKDGVEMDFNSCYPTKFRPYQASQPSIQQPQQPQPQMAAAADGDNPPF